MNGIATLDDVIARYDAGLLAAGVAPTHPLALEERDRLARMHRAIALSTVGDQVRAEDGRAMADQSILNVAQHASPHCSGTRN